MIENASCNFPFFSIYFKREIIYFFRFSVYPNIKNLFLAFFASFNRNGTVEGYCFSII